jgi:hypothetical protein
MAAVRQLCNNGIVLQNGKIVLHCQNIDDAVAFYLHRNQNKNETNCKELIKQAISGLPEDESVKLLNVKLMQNSMEIIDQVSNDTPLDIEIHYEVIKQEKGLRAAFDLCDQFGDIIFRSFHDDDNTGISDMKPGTYISRARIPKNLLGNTTYIITIYICIFNVRHCTGDGICIPIAVNNTAGYNPAYSNVHFFRGKLNIALKWDTHKL